MRELQALVAPNPPQGFLKRGQAGLVINKLTQGVLVGGQSGLVINQLSLSLFAFAGGGVRASVSILQQGVVRERIPGPSFS